MEAPRHGHREGFDLSEPIQEDYGWGFWVARGPDPFWVAFSFCGEGPTEGPAEWVVSVAYDPGLNLLKRLFHKPDRQALARLRARAVAGPRLYPRNHGVS